MNIDVILKIAGVGLLTAIVNMVLKKCDKDEIATLTTIVGLIVALAMVVDMVGGLFQNVKSVFGF